MRIENYTHRPGIHCGSTAMRNILSHLGAEFPEEVLFGLGEGIFFIYVRYQPVPPYVAIHGRSLDLEEVLGRRLGLKVEIHRSSDPDIALEETKKLIALGFPVLINTDIKFLDYFNSSTHFSGHRVVVVGIEDGGNCLISDSEFPTLKPIEVGSLKVARQSELPPFGEPNLAVTFRGTVQPPGSEELKAAVVSSAKRMLFPETPLFGVPGMLTASREMERWHKMTETPDFAARFAYQVIEKRGTGGGFFRRMYGRFLIHCGRVTGREEFIHLSEEMEKIADAWTDLAQSLKEASGDCSPEKMKKCGEKLGDLAAKEDRFYREILLLFT